jgi:hypothetical protein
MNFTDNNHLVYNIGGRDYGYRENSMEKYTVRVGAVDPDRYSKSSYADELHRIAELVRQDLGRDLILFLSGGTDSEIVLRNFLHTGFKPRCVTLRFNNGYNLEDINEAKAITNELGVKLDIIDIDIEDFYYSGEAAEFGEQIQCTQITYIMVYKNVLRLGAPAVMGGEALLTRQINLIDSFWYYTLRENEDASAMRFSNKFGIPLVNEWYSYTPEILLHWLENDNIRELVSNRYNYKLNSASSKNAILSTLYSSRPKAKTHGFERLLDFNQEVYRELGHNQIKRLEPSIDGIAYNDAIKQLKGF